MNLLDLPWEIILIILKQYNDYKYCIRLLVTCTQLYDNELLMKEIKDNFTECRVDQYGIQRWYLNGKLHRDNDKPAIIYQNGTQYWYFNGKIHRDNDKPAIISEAGYKEWLFNGKPHRENGPAIIHPDGNKFWCLNNKSYSEEEYWKEIDKINSLKN